MVFQRVATLEVENEHLQFLKTIKPLDADQSTEAPPTSAAVNAAEDSSNNTLDDLGFPDDDPQADGTISVSAILFHFF